MATTRKRRTGTARVYDDATMSTNFPKSHKLVRQYKFTVYADGRIVKTAISAPKKRKTSKSRRK